MSKLLITISQISMTNFANLIDINTELYDWQFTFGQFLIFLFIFILGLILTVAVPNIVAVYIADYVLAINKKAGRYKRLGKRQKRELQKQFKSKIIAPIQNILRLTIFIIFSFISLLALGYSFDTEFNIVGYPLTFEKLIIFIISILISAFFIGVVFPWLLKISIYSIIGKSVKRSDLNATHKSLESPISYLLSLVMFHVAFHIAFPEPSRIGFYESYLALFVLFYIIIWIYLITILILRLFHIKYILPMKMDSHAAVAFDNLIKVAAFLFAIGLLLTYYGVQIEQIAFVLALLGFAIAFGMQNTIANIMAGFALATDKPFRIGDRIRVGEVGRETWGDVIDIGLNTTKIKTIEEEIVVIPNNYIASNEVWNYTKGSPVYALTFKVGVSYGSSWRLSKKLIIEEMQKHPYVLRKPQPFVRIDSYGEFSINMVVWAWLRNARDKDQIRSDLLEAIKDRFDAEGVEIPFPYRTIIYKKELPTEKRLPIGVKFDNIRRYPSKGRDYFEVGEGPLKGIPVSKVVHEEDVKILTPVSGMHNAKRLAQYSMSLARKINGNVTALYIVPGKSKEMEVEGLKCLGVFEQSGANYNINVATKIEAGSVVEQILETIEKDHINLVVIGGGRKAFLGTWGHESIANEIIERSTVPVVTMPYKLKWY